LAGSWGRARKPPPFPFPDEGVDISPQVGPLSALFPNRPLTLIERLPNHPEIPA
jgi:hypothetical protein